MRTDPADFRHLILLIQRILDADTLCDEEGAALLTESEAASRSLEVGDTEVARQHVEQVADLTEALVRSEAIGLADGRAILETARHVLAGDTDCPPDRRQAGRIFVVEGQT